MIVNYIDVFLSR